MFFLRLVESREETVVDRRRRGGEGIESKSFHSGAERSRPALVLYRLSGRIISGILMRVTAQ
jgi:hypothetical protein